MRPPSRVCAGVLSSLPPADSMRSAVVAASEVFRYVFHTGGPPAPDVGGARAATGRSSLRHRTWSPDPRRVATKVQPSTPP